MYIWKKKSRINRRNNINQRYYYNKYFNVSKAIIYITTTLFILLINSVHNVKSWPKAKGGGDVLTKDSKIKTTERGAHSPERIPEMETGGDCFGLPQKQCPQYAFLRGMLSRAGPDYVTPGMTRTCRIEFCNPLCLHAVKCHVKAEGEFAVAASGDYSEALCRQVIGKACLDTGCCKDKDVSGNHNMMYDWVMRGASSDSDNNEESFPMDVCARDSTDPEETIARCAACKAAAIKVKIEIDENVCCQYAAECDHGKLGLNRHYEDEWAIPMGTLRRTDVTKFWFPYMRNNFFKQGSEGGTYNSLEERCIYFLGHIGGAMKKAAKAFNADKICSCMGCCDAPDGHPCNFDNYDEESADDGVNTEAEPNPDKGGGASDEAAAAPPPPADGKPPVKDEKTEEPKKEEEPKKQPEEKPPPKEEEPKKEPEEKPPPPPKDPNQKTNEELNQASAKKAVEQEQKQEIIDNYAENSDNRKLARITSKGTVTYDDELKGELSKLSYEGNEGRFGRADLYHPEWIKPPPGYEVDKELSTRTGTVFRNTKTGDVTVAYKGSNLGTSGSDWKADGHIAKGNEDHEHNHNALEQMQKVQQKYPNQKIDATGQSLGGSTAIAVGRETGVPVTAFNPGGAALQGHNVEKCATCRIVVTDGDIISRTHKHHADVVIKNPPGLFDDAHGLYPKLKFKALEVFKFAPKKLSLQNNKKPNENEPSLRLLAKSESLVRVKTRMSDIPSLHMWLYIHKDEW